MPASAHFGGDIVLWDVPGGKTAAQLGDKDQFFATSLAFSPDGKMLATAVSSSGHLVLKGKGSLIRVWDVTTRNNTVGLELGKEPRDNTVLAFNSDGKTLASGGGGHAIKIWKVVSQEAK